MIDPVETIPAAGNAWHIAAGDIDADGNTEIVCACYNGDVCRARPVPRESLWPAHTDGSFPFDLCVADIDGDGKSEVLVATAGGALYVFDFEGKPKWESPFIPGVPAYSPAPLYQVAVAQFDGVTCIFTGGVDGNIYALNPDGCHVGTFPQNKPIRLLRAGKVLGDGNDQLVFARHSGKVFLLEPSVAARDVKGAVTQLNLTGGLLTTLHEVEHPTPLRVFRPYHLHLADLTGDGKCDLLFGGSFYNQCGIKILYSDGTAPFCKTDGFADVYAGTYYSHTRLATFQLPSMQEPHIPTLTGNRLRVFDANDGLPVETATADSAVPFADLKVHDGHAYLASAPNGDDSVYMVDLSQPWSTIKELLEDLSYEGKMKHVKENIDQLLGAVDSYPNEPPEGRIYDHIVTWGAPKTNADFYSHFRRLQDYRKQFKYDNCRFSMGINVGEDQLETRERLHLFEEEGYTFFAIVGHGCTPKIDLKTARQILEACPNSCLGFLSSENSRHDNTLRTYLKSFWIPLMGLCKKENKKAILVEKGAWWATIPAMAKFSGLLDAKYKDVLVPSVEDSNSRTPELNLAGRLGLFQSGLVNTWSGRTVPDEMCWHRFWEWEYVQNAHPYLRRQIVQALLGATIFEYHHTPAHQEKHIGFTDFGRKLLGPFIHMLGRELLIPPTRDKMVNTSPVVIRMREPATSFLKEAFTFFPWDNQFQWDAEERESPFEGVACHWGFAPVQPHYMGSYLLGQDRHGLNLAPATPWGVPAIVPEWVDLHGESWVEGEWETDGRYVYDGGQRSGADARNDILASFEQAAQQLPFQVEGRVFMQAQRVRQHVYRVTMVDSGILDPDDRACVLHIRPGKADPPATAISSVTGLLGDTDPSVQNNTVHVTVPAGTLAILEVELEVELEE
jgi:hypothetical protein